MRWSFGKSWTALAAAGILGAVSTLATPGAAFADSGTPFACQADPYVKIVKVGGPTYQTIGPAAGKRNGSTTTEQLQYSLSVTITRSSSWSVGGSISIKAGIASIEANSSYSVEQSSATNRTVTNGVNVPAGWYGATQPTVEFQEFDIQHWQTRGNCKGDYETSSDGTINTIVKDPTFFECTTSGSDCTPHS